MLQELIIKNFAIIDDLHMSFSEGLTVLSGETGAGKSIIINGVNLLLGSRAAVRLIRTGAETAELEALFKISEQSETAGCLKELDYYNKETLLIRRIISRNERHRIYINGRLATIQALGRITGNLASISGQHAHQGLLKEDEQLIILDRFGGLLPLRSEIYRIFNEISPIVKRLKKLDLLKKRQKEQIELLEFQKKEITEAAVVNLNEDSELERERVLLKNGEALYGAVNHSIEELYSSQGAVVERIVEVKKNIENACRIDENLNNSAKALDDISFGIEDIVQELRSYSDNIRTDDRRLEDVEMRLDTLKKLKKKYGGSLEKIKAHLETIDMELKETENISHEIDETKAMLSNMHKELGSLCIKLSEKRKNTAVGLSKKVEKELDSLNMSKTKFEIFFKSTPADDNTDRYFAINGSKITETGIDSISFMIAPNLGETLKPLSNIVSGGELSRVVLALMAILAEIKSVETVIFDEVDAGIGGGVAETVGKKLRALSKHHQIICITHLPQIAKFGDHHFRISKNIKDGRTATLIESLGKDERVNEIARMLGGIKITNATIDHAKEMLQDAKG